MATKSKKKNNDAAVAAEVGAGVLAAAAAIGAGYYFYGAKGAKKHRQAASKWAKDLKKTVVKDAKKVTKLSKREVALLVDRAAKTYETARNVKREDLLLAANELKNNWQELERELSAAAKKGTKSLARPVKKAAKVAPKKKAAPKKAAPKKKVAKKR